MLELCNGAGWSWAPIGQGKHFGEESVGLDEGVTTPACVGGAGHFPCRGWDGSVEDAALKLLLCNFLAAFCIAPKGFGEAGSLVAAARATSPGLAIFVDMHRRQIESELSARAAWLEAYLEQLPLGSLWRVGLGLVGLVGGVLCAC